MDEFETGRITIRRVLTDDGDDVCYLECEGDAERVVDALGMLAMAQDTILHPPADDDH